MARKFVDCREMGGDCTVMISADNEDEVVTVAAQHAAAKHGHQDTPEFREELRRAVKEEVRV